MNEVLLRPVRAVVLGVATGLAAVAAMAPVAPQAAEPWGFEQVTPVGKGSGTVSSADTFQASPDGDALLHTALLPYADVPSESVPAYVRYIARRGATAWFNRALDPPFTYGAEPGTAQNVQLVTASSADLAYVMVASQRALTPGAIEGGSNLYLRDTRTGEYTLVAKHSSPSLALSHGQHGGGPVNVKYVAPDGQSAMLLASHSLAPGAPENGPSDPATLYVWTADEGMRAVSVLPESEGGAVVGVDSAGRDGPYDARDALPVGNDALTHIYFGAVVNGEVGGVYVRTGDETKAVSVSRIPGDPSTPVRAQVRAVREGGRYLVFSTYADTPLTVDTPDLGSTEQHLYRYDVVDDSLTYVGTMSTGAAVTQVVGVSDDARTVAFKSLFALAGDAVAGVNNMYVWRDGVLRFVSAPDPGSSGEAPNNQLRRMSPSGRYLAYTDNSLSLAARFGIDNFSARCRTLFGTPGGCDLVYLYDFVEDELECVSCRPDGGTPAGNTGDPTNRNDGAARLNGYVPRTVTDDGTAFFTSTDSYVAEDRNSADDVYAYRDGQYRLVSRAAQGKRYRFLDATPDGKTVFFSTDDPIVGTDNDRSVDIYMTREGAGYSYTAPVVTPPCSGSDCRDPFAPPAPLAVAGSVAFSGLGNVEGRPSAGAVRVSKLRTAIGAGAWLRVRVPVAGRVQVSGAGLKRSSTTARKAGSYRVAVRLSKRARQKLKDDRRVRVRVTVRFAPKAGRPSAKRFAMTFKASSTRKGR